MQKRRFSSASNLLLQNSHPFSLSTIYSSFSLLCLSFTYQYTNKYLSSSLSVSFPIIISVRFSSTVILKPIIISISKLFFLLSDTPTLCFIGNEVSSTPKIYFHHLILSFLPAIFYPRRLSSHFPFLFILLFRSLIFYFFHYSLAQLFVINFIFFN